MKKLITVLILLVTSTIVLMTIIYFSLSDYPILIKNAYYKNPYNAIQAVYAEHISEKNVSKDEALKKIEGIGLKPKKNEIRFRYLPHEPLNTEEKPIIEKYISLLTKVDIEIPQSTSFWEVAEDNGIVLFGIESNEIIYFEMDGMWSSKPKYFSVSN